MEERTQLLQQVLEDLRAEAAARDTTKTQAREEARAEAEARVRLEEEAAQLLAVGTWVWRSLSAFSCL
jgi:hypothetical protein